MAMGAHIPPAGAMMTASHDIDDMVKVVLMLISSGGVEIQYPAAVKPHQIHSHSLIKPASVDLLPQIIFLGASQNSFLVHLHQMADGFLSQPHPIFYTSLYYLRI